MKTENFSWDFKKMRLESIEDFFGWVSSLGAQFKVTRVSTSEIENDQLTINFDFEEGITTNVLSKKVSKEK